MSREIGKCLYEATKLEELPVQIHIGLTMMSLAILMTSVASKISPRW